MSSMSGAKISVNPHPIAPFVPALEGVGDGVGGGGGGGWGRPLIVA